LQDAQVMKYKISESETLCRTKIQPTLVYFS